jgi:uncharacterized membrane protein YjgN (DUF898 family)
MSHELRKEGTGAVGPLAPAFAGGAFVNEMSSVPHFPPPPPLPAPSVKADFSGDRGDFFRLVRKGAGLELVTFGFYRFWLATDIRRHLWLHTSLDGDAPEYTGSARELLIGFLFALAILVPIYLAYFLIGIEAERAKAFASFPLFLFFYLFGQFAIYRARRYRLTRTVWRGVRFWMDGSGWAYAARAAAWNLLTVATLGLALPWRAAALERYKMRHCYYGDLQGSFEGRGWEFFKRGWWLWLLAVVQPTLLLVVVASNWPAQIHIPWYLALQVLVGAPFLYGAFKAIEWRWWISGIRFGEVSFESDLSKRALYGLYWKVIGWSVPLLIVLMIYINICVGLLKEMGLAPYAVFSTKGEFYGSVTMLVLGGLGCLVFLLAMNVVLRVYLLRDVWARAAASTAVFHLEAAANVAAKGELASALGEGLAGGLDIVGF